MGKHKQDQDGHDDWQGGWPCDAGAAVASPHHLLWLMDVPPLDNGQYVDGCFRLSLVPYCLRIGQELD